MMNKKPKIDTRKYLTQAEREEYDSLAIANSFGGLTVVSEKRVNQLQAAALERFALSLIDDGYTSTLRDRIVHNIANFILRFASPEYQMILWSMYNYGLIQSGVKEIR